MARPRDEDKRRAILDAALRVFAEHGIAGTPTRAISKAAGVAEGSLFTYFKTKDELLNDLYLELRQEFSRHLPDFPHAEDTRDRLRYMWNKYLELGAEHPARLKVLAQLRVSGKLFRENETPPLALVEIIRIAREVSAGTELEKVPTEYLVLMVRAQLEITVEFINAHPEAAEACRELGFQMLWRGLTERSLLA
jgi:AcrR family transcriptional regulator